MATSAGAITTPGYKNAQNSKDAPGTLDANKVAEATLKSLGKGPITIPGFTNKMAHFFMGRFIIMTQLAGFFTPWIIYAVITFLHYFLPGKWMTGYVRHSQTGELLKYRLNGRLVLITSIVLWFLLGYLGWV